MKTNEIGLYEELLEITLPLQHFNKLISNLNPDSEDGLIWSIQELCDKVNDEVEERIEKLEKILHKKLGHEIILEYDEEDPAQIIGARLQKKEEQPDLADLDIGEEAQP